MGSTRIQDPEWLQTGEVAHAIHYTTTHISEAPATGRNTDRYTTNRVSDMKETLSTQKPTQDPGKTRQPHNCDKRTPATSESGSEASGMADLTVTPTSKGNTGESTTSDSNPCAGFHETHDSNCRITTEPLTAKETTAERTITDLEPRTAELHVTVEEDRDTKGTADPIDIGTESLTTTGTTARTIYTGPDPNPEIQATIEMDRNIGGTIDLTRCDAEYLTPTESTSGTLRRNLDPNVEIHANHNSDRHARGAACVTKYPFTTEIVAGTTLTDSDLHSETHATHDLDCHTRGTTDRPKFGTKHLTATEIAAGITTTNASPNLEYHGNLEPAREIISIKGLTHPRIESLTAAGATPGITSTDQGANSKIYVTLDGNFSGTADLKKYHTTTEITAGISLTDLDSNLETQRTLDSKCDIRSTTVPTGFSKEHLTATTSAGGTTLTDLDPYVVIPDRDIRGTADRTVLGTKDLTGDGTTHTEMGKNPIYKETHEGTSTDPIEIGAEPLSATGATSGITITDQDSKIHVTRDGDHNTRGNAYRIESTTKNLTATEIAAGTRPTDLNSNGDIYVANESGRVRGGPTSPEETGTNPTTSTESNDGTPSIDSSPNLEFYKTPEPAREVSSFAGIMYIGTESLTGNTPRITFTDKDSNSEIHGTPEPTVSSKELLTETEITGGTSPNAHTSDPKIHETANENCDIRDTADPIRSGMEYLTATESADITPLTDHDSNFETLDFDSKETGDLKVSGTESLTTKGTTSGITLKGQDPNSEIDVTLDGDRHTGGTADRTESKTKYLTAKEIAARTSLTDPDSNQWTRAMFDLNRNVGGTEDSAVIGKEPPTDKETTPTGPRPKLDTQAALDPDRDISGIVDPKETGKELPTTPGTAAGTSPLGLNPKLEIHATPQLDQGTELRAASRTQDGTTTMDTSPNPEACTTLGPDQGKRDTAGKTHTGTESSDGWKRTTGNVLTGAQSNLEIHGKSDGHGDTKSTADLAEFGMEPRMRARSTAGKSPTRLDQNLGNLETIEGDQNIGGMEDWMSCAADHLTDKRIAVRTTLSDPGANPGALDYSMKGTTDRTTLGNELMTTTETIEGVALKDLNAKSESHMMRDADREATGTAGGGTRKKVHPIDTAITTCESRCVYGRSIIPTETAGAVGVPKVKSRSKGVSPADLSQASRNKVSLSFGSGLVPSLQVHDGIATTRIRSNPELRVTIMSDRDASRTAGRTHTGTESTTPTDPQPYTEVQWKTDKHCHISGTANLAKERTEFRISTRVTNRTTLTSTDLNLENLANTRSLRDISRSAVRTWRITDYPNAMEIAAKTTLKDPDENFEVSNCAKNGTTGPIELGSERTATTEITDNTTAVEITAGTTPCNPEENPEDSDSAKKGTTGQTELGSELTPTTKTTDGTTPEPDRTVRRAADWNRRITRYPTAMEIVARTNSNDPEGNLEVRDCATIVTTGPTELGSELTTTTESTDCPTAMEITAETTLWNPDGKSEVSSCAMKGTAGPTELDTELTSTTETTDCATTMEIAAGTTPCDPDGNSEDSDCAMNGTAGPTELGSELTTTTEITDYTTTREVMAGTTPHDPDGNSEVSDCATNGTAGPTELGSEFTAATETTDCTTAMVITAGTTLGDPDENSEVSDCATNGTAGPIALGSEFTAATETTDGATAMEIAAGTTPSALDGNSKISDCAMNETAGPTELGSGLTTTTETTDCTTTMEIAAGTTLSGPDGNSEMRVRAMNETAGPTEFGSELTTTTAIKECPTAMEIAADTTFCNPNENSGVSDCAINGTAGPTELGSELTTTTETTDRTPRSGPDSNVDIRWSLHAACSDRAAPGKECLAATDSIEGNHPNDLDPNADSRKTLGSEGDRGGTTDPTALGVEYFAATRSTAGIPLTVLAENFGISHSGKNGTADSTETHETIVMNQDIRGNTRGTELPTSMGISAGNALSGPDFNSEIQVTPILGRDIRRTVDPHVIGAKSPVSTGMTVKTTCTDLGSDTETDATDDLDRYARGNADRGPWTVCLTATGIDARISLTSLNTNLESCTTCESGSVLGRTAGPAVDTGSNSPDFTETHDGTATINTSPNLELHVSPDLNHVVKYTAAMTDIGTESHDDHRTTTGTTVTDPHLNPETQTTRNRDHDTIDTTARVAPGMEYLTDIDTTARTYLTDPESYLDITVTHEFGYAHGRITTPVEIVTNPHTASESKGRTNLDRIEIGRESPTSTETNAEIALADQEHTSGIPATLDEERDLRGTADPFEISAGSLKPMETTARTTLTNPDSADRVPGTVYLTTTGIAARISLTSLNSNLESGTTYESGRVRRGTTGPAAETDRNSPDLTETHDGTTTINISPNLKFHVSLDLDHAVKHTAATTDIGTEPHDDQRTSAGTTSTDPHLNQETQTTSNLDRDIKDTTDRVEPGTEYLTDTESTTRTYLTDPVSYLGIPVTHESGYAHGRTISLAETATNPHAASVSKGGTNTDWTVFGWELPTAMEITTETALADQELTSVIPVTLDEERDIRGTTDPFEISAGSLKPMETTTRTTLSDVGTHTTHDLDRDASGTADWAARAMKYLSATVIVAGTLHTDLYSNSDILDCDIRGTTYPPGPETEASLGGPITPAETETRTTLHDATEITARTIRTILRLHLDTKDTADTTKTSTETLTAARSTAEITLTGISPKWGTQTTPESDQEIRGTAVFDRVTKFSTVVETAKGISPSDQDANSDNPGCNTRGTGGLTKRGKEDLTEMSHTHTGTRDGDTADRMEIGRESLTAAETTPRNIFTDQGRNAIWCSADPTASDKKQIAAAVSTDGFPLKKTGFSECDIRGATHRTGLGEEHPATAVVTASTQRSLHWKRDILGTTDQTGSGDVYLDTTESIIGISLTDLAVNSGIFHWAKKGTANLTETQETTERNQLARSHAPGIELPTINGISAGTTLKGPDFYPATQETLALGRDVRNTADPTATGGNPPTPKETTAGTICTDLGSHAETDTTYDLNRDAKSTTKEHPIVTETTTGIYMTDREPYTYTPTTPDWEPDTRSTTEATATGQEYLTITEITSGISQTDPDPDLDTADLTVDSNEHPTVTETTAGISTTDLNPTGDTHKTDLECDDEDTVDATEIGGEHNTAKETAAGTSLTYPNSKLERSDTHVSGRATGGNTSPAETRTNPLTPSETHDRVGTTGTSPNLEILRTLVLDHMVRSTAEKMDIGTESLHDKEITTGITLTDLYPNPETHATPDLEHDTSGTAGRSASGEGSLAATDITTGISLSDLDVDIMSTLDPDREVRGMAGTMHFRTLSPAAKGSTAITTPICIDFNSKTRAKPEEERDNKGTAEPANIGTASHPIGGITTATTSKDLDSMLELHTYVANRVTDPHAPHKTPGPTATGKEPLAATEIIGAIAITDIDPNSGILRPPALKHDTRGADGLAVSGNEYPAATDAFAGISLTDIDPNWDVGGAAGLMTSVQNTRGSTDPTRIQEILELNYDIKGTTDSMVMGRVYLTVTELTAVTSIIDPNSDIQTVCPLRDTRDTTDLPASGKEYITATEITIGSSLTNSGIPDERGTADSTGIRDNTTQNLDIRGKVNGVEQLHTAAGITPTGLDFRLEPLDREIQGSDGLNGVLETLEPLVLNTEPPNYKEITGGITSIDLDSNTEIHTTYNWGSDTLGTADRAALGAEHLTAMEFTAGTFLTNLKPNLDISDTHEPGLAHGRTTTPAETATNRPTSTVSKDRTNADPTGIGTEPFATKEIAPGTTRTDPDYNPGIHMTHDLDRDTRGNSDLAAQGIEHRTATENTYGTVETETNQTSMVIKDGTNTNPTEIGSGLLVAKGTAPGITRTNLDCDTRGNADRAVLGTSHLPAIHIDAGTSRTDLNPNSGILGCDIKGHANQEGTDTENHTSGTTIPAEMGEHPSTYTETYDGATTCLIKTRVESIDDKETTGGTTLTDFERESRIRVTVQYDRDIRGTADLIGSGTTYPTASEIAVLTTSTDLDPQREILEDDIRDTDDPTVLGKQNAPATEITAGTARTDLDPSSAIQKTLGLECDIRPKADPMGLANEHLTSTEITAATGLAPNSGYSRKQSGSADRLELGKKHPSVTDRITGTRSGILTTPVWVRNAGGTIEATTSGPEHLTAIELANRFSLEQTAVIIDIPTHNETKVGSILRDRVAADRVVLDAEHLTATEPTAGNIRTDLKSNLDIPGIDELGLAPRGILTSIEKARNPLASTESMDGTNSDPTGIGTEPLATEIVPGITRTDLDYKVGTHATHDFDRHTRDPVDLVALDMTYHTHVGITNEIYTGDFNSDLQTLFTYEFGDVDHRITTLAETGMDTLTLLEIEDLTETDTVLLGANETASTMTQSADLNLEIGARHTRGTTAPTVICVDSCMSIGTTIRTTCTNPGPKKENHSTYELAGDTRGTADPEKVEHINRRKRDTPDRPADVKEKALLANASGQEADPTTREHPQRSVTSMKSKGEQLHESKPNHTETPHVPHQDATTPNRAPGLAGDHLTDAPKQGAAESPTSVDTNGNPDRGTTAMSKPVAALLTHMGIMDSSTSNINHSATASSLRAAHSDGGTAEQERTDPESPTTPASAARTTFRTGKPPMAKPEGETGVIRSNTSTIGRTSADRAKANTATHMTGSTGGNCTTQSAYTPITAGHVEKANTTRKLTTANGITTCTDERPNSEDADGICSITSTSSAAGCASAGCLTSIADTNKTGSNTGNCLRKRVTGPITPGPNENADRVGITTCKNEYPKARGEDRFGHGRTAFTTRRDAADCSTANTGTHTMGPTTESAHTEVGPDEGARTSKIADGTSACEHSKGAHEGISSTNTSSATRCALAGGSTTKVAAHTNGPATRNCSRKSAMAPIMDGPFKNANRIGNSTTAGRITACKNELPNSGYEDRTSSTGSTSSACERASAERLVSAVPPAATTISNTAGLTSDHRLAMTGNMTRSTSTDCSEVTTCANMAGLTLGHCLTDCFSAITSANTAERTSDHHPVMTGNMTRSTSTDYSETRGHCPTGSNTSPLTKTKTGTLSGSASVDRFSAITSANTARLTSDHRPAMTGNKTRSTSTDYSETLGHCPTGSNTSPLTKTKTGTLSGSASVDCFSVITYANTARLTFDHRPVTTGNMTRSTFTDCSEVTTYANMAGLTLGHCPTVSNTSPLTETKTGTLSGSASVDCFSAITSVNTAGLTPIRRPTTTGTKTGGTFADCSEVTTYANTYANMAGLTLGHCPTVSNTSPLTETMTGTLSGSASGDCSATITLANMAGPTWGHGPTMSTASPMTGNMTGTTGTMTRTGTMTAPMTRTMTGTMTGSMIGTGTMTESTSADYSEAITSANTAELTSVHRPTVTGTMNGSIFADCSAETNGDETSGIASRPKNRRVARN
ncbi:MAG: hypothetical protein KVP17_002872 [Porospora cf. gigantea B]|uniref:uncharacterized protein n=1 Tax=Porospora cf. gigantea B TaxID=2853592 RepID=UPI0035719EE7|nr:MAG: hypothetical protein KVP17_002872 [Porospora cf. gigantea B]